MGYDVTLSDSEGIPCIVDKHEDCGNYHVLDGSDIATMGITYNYSPFYYGWLDTEKGLRWLYGKTGKECQQRLENAIKQLGVNRYSNYWEQTAGNAGYALSILLKWVKQHPTAKFSGD